MDKIEKLKQELKEELLEELKPPTILELPEREKQKQWENDLLNKLRVLGSWDLEGVKRSVSAVPTHKPKNREGQIIFYTSGATYRVYIWVGSWKYISLT